MYDRLAIYLFYGRKGSGKSYTQARDAVLLFQQYRALEKKYPMLPRRIYLSNQKFSKEVEDKELGVHLFYWTNAQQLRWCPRRLPCFLACDLRTCPDPKKKKKAIPHPIHSKHAVHDADISHDEISKDLPAGSWTDTPKWFKQIFSHLRKRGNRYFANTQVYEDIDISFRRQIDFAWEVRKAMGSPDVTATSPPPKRVWGLIFRRAFDPSILEWERDPNARESLRDQMGRFTFPQIIPIRKKYISVYDTHEELPPYKPDTMEHQEVWCENDDCPAHGRKEGKPKLRHPII